VGERRYRVALAPAAQRQLARFERPAQRRITRVIRALESDPRPRGAVLLKGWPDGRAWRIRVGDYRVIYEVRDEDLIVLVIRVGQRADVYRLE